MITQKQFNDKYDGEYRFTAIYKDKHGDICKGLLLDCLQISDKGHLFVNINNFNTKAILGIDLFDIQNTGKTWV